MGTKLIRVVDAYYGVTAWKDPWGKGQPAYVVTGELELTRSSNSDHHIYFDGYGNKKADVFTDAEGLLYYNRAPSDLTGRTVYALIRRDPGRRSRFWHVPQEGTRYLRNGVPVRWNREKDDWDELA